MKIYKLPILGGLIGLFIITISTVRWFFVWPDYSQLIYTNLLPSILVGFGIFSGGVILILSYVYNWMKAKDEHINDIKSGLDRLTGWCREEIEKINPEASYPPLPNKKIE